MFDPMPTKEQRQRWLRVLACAEPDALAQLMAEHQTDGIDLRAAEVGLAMVTGRVGATGDAFGLGEMTLTRCVVQVGSHIGVGYVRGRAPQHARRVALADALLQGEAHDRVATGVIEPLAQLQARREAERAAEVDTSRVQFLTMVRGN